MIRVRLALFVLLLGFVVPTRPQEVQKHGVVFEKWIRDTFFDGYTPPSYTHIPSEANKRFGGILVNPKATKYRTAVDLGDALRQYDIQEPFWPIIGYWRQDGLKKHFVNVVAARRTRPISSSCGEKSRAPIWKSSLRSSKKRLRPLRLDKRRKS